jgi:NADH-quinone oxidoreductase subunit C
MVDVDVRLGLSGSDLMIRDRTFKADLSRLSSGSLAPENSLEIQALVAAGLGDEIVASKRFRKQDFLIVKKAKIVQILTVMRDDPSCRYDLVSDIFGVDLLGFETELRFEVVYSLYSIGHLKRIVIKAQVEEDEAAIDSVNLVWPAADWAEREIFDLFGIHFNNHPDLRRILMPDDWNGHPLRKDFPLGGEEVEFSHNVREQGKSN